MTIRISVPSAEGIKQQLKDNRLVKAEIFLLLALMVYNFVPSINQLIVDRLVSGLGSDVLNIAGQIEWFDLFNETILAFLTVPMYFVFNKARGDKDELGTRINQTFTLGFVTYLIMSLAIYVYASSLTAYMNAPAESTAYLRLETVGFIIGFVSSYMYVVFVVHGRYDYIVILLVAKVAMLSIGNLELIPDNGVTGIALTNIGVNSIISAVSVLLLYREGLICRWNGFRKDIMYDWARTGLFSGGQVFLANFIYVLSVMKMINDVSQVGNYWLANNFIWGWLLVPMYAIGEMVKREYYNGYNRIWNYLALTGIVLLVWLISIPLWGVMFRDVIGAEDADMILSTLYKLVPFYIAYALCVVFQGVMTAVGRTELILAEAAVVNIVYYGILYGLFLAGVFEATMDFVILLFGFGMVVSLFLDIGFYLYSKRLTPGNDGSVEPVGVE